MWGVQYYFWIHKSSKRHENLVTAATEPVIVIWQRINQPAKTDRLVNNFTSIVDTVCISKYNQHLRSFHRTLSLVNGVADAILALVPSFLIH